MHSVMAILTLVMGAAGIAVVILFGIAAHEIPEIAMRSGAVYFVVLALATFANERIRRHLVVEDPDSSPPCCAPAARIGRVLIVLAWISMAVLLVYLLIHTAA